MKISGLPIFRRFFLGSNNLQPKGLPARVGSFDFAERLNTGRKFLVEQRDYGFTLRQGCNGAARATYLIDVDGYDLVVSDNQYVEIDLPETTVYLASNHNAACFFVKQEEMRGMITGSEEWIHIDKKEHPDNQPFDKDPGINPLSPMGEIAYGLEENVDFDTGISVANFMTAIAKQYPGMTFRFLHDANNAKEAVLDWGGMEFLERAPLLHWVPTKIGKEERILSVDLDCLGYSYYSRMRQSDEMYKRIIELAKSSKLAMFFSSPSYLGRESGQIWLERVASEFTR